VRKTIGGVTVAVLLGAIIVTMGSCQPTVANDKPQTVQIRFDAEAERWKVPPLTVYRAGKVMYQASDTDVWMLFPGDFDYVEGQGTFCKTRNMLAVAIPKEGFAVIEVPESFPDPEVDQKISYSVMLRLEKANGKIDWQYAHGENPPPKIIIPKKRSG
jgi:hypothetical protein